MKVTENRIKQFNKIIEHCVSGYTIKDVDHFDVDKNIVMFIGDQLIITTNNIILPEYCNYWKEFFNLYKRKYKIKKLINKLC